MPRMKQVEVLRQLIRVAFPSRPFLGAVTGGCDCDECCEIATTLNLQSWDAISDETLNVQFGALPLLSSEAFSAFLPAWLNGSLSKLDADEQKVREWTLYSLALYYEDGDEAAEIAAKTECLRLRFATLTPEQTCVVTQWLLLLRDHARVTHWHRESIDRALHLLNAASPTHSLNEVGLAAVERLDQGRIARSN